VEVDHPVVELDKVVVADSVKVPDKVGIKAARVPALIPETPKPVPAAEATLVIAP
jgi:hypothetical protein